MTSHRGQYDVISTSCACWGKNFIIFTERERERERVREKMSRRSPVVRGWSGGAMVLGKLSVPRRPTNLDNSRARAYCACSRYGWGLFGHF